jgi:DNA-binding response OmpR family regulator
MTTSQPPPNDSPEVKQMTPLKVLVVEDDREIREMVALMVKGIGYSVSTATTGKEALVRLQESRHDIVLLDLMMPDMDGWEVYQQMKADEKTKNIPVIVVTAKAQSIDKVLGLHIAKVDDYIAKPFSPQELMSSVEKVLNKTKA